MEYITEYILSMTIITGGSGEKIQLQLGDIIRIVSPQDPTYNDAIFYIYYIDSDKIKLVNVDDFSNHVLTITAQGTLDNTAIQTIELLNRADTPSYAKQNHLDVSKWVNITFAGDVPFIVTGEIVAVDKDMIEVRTVPDKELLYVNFDYKGLPDYIQYIEIRPAPDDTGVAPLPLMDESAVAAATATAPEQEPEPDQQPGQVFFDMDNVKIGTVEMAPIVQYVNVGENAQRYGLEAQITDLLDDLLSSIPTLDRTPAVMKDIHTTITRFKYLREHFSIFDENHNIIRPLYKLPSHKPLVEWLNAGMPEKLLWLVPVIAESKKYYVDDDVAATAAIAAETNTTYITPLSFPQTLADIEALYQQFKTNNAANEGIVISDTNKVVQYYQHLAPYMTPYSTATTDDVVGGANATDDIIRHMTVKPTRYTNIYTIMNNNGDFTISNLNNQAVPFFGQVVTQGLQRLVSKYAMAGSRKQITEIAPMTPNDAIDLRSFMTMPMPMVKQSAIYLPGGSSTIYDIAVKSQTPVQTVTAYYNMLSAATSVTTYDVGAGVGSGGDTRDNERHFITTGQFSNFQPDKIPTYKQIARTQYDTYADALVPRNRTLFHLMRPHLDHSKGVSYAAFVDQLEPFLIYQTDITHALYTDIVKYIGGVITQYNKTLVDNVKTLVAIKKYKPTAGLSKTRQFPVIFDVITNQTAREDVIAGYQLAEFIGGVGVGVGGTAAHTADVCTDAEIQLKMRRADYDAYYSAVCALQNLALVIPEPIIRMLEGGPDEESERNNRAADCKTIVIAKTYLTEGDLINDNGNPNVFFDAKNDTTNYSILEDFEKQLTTMTASDFMPFLIGKLKSGFKLSETNAAYMAETLIAGRKRIIDGQYAVLASAPDGGATAPLVYYIRKSNQWVKTPEPPINGIAATDPATLCNTQDQCINVPQTQKFTHDREQIKLTDDKCAPILATKKEQHAKLLKQIVAEFDTDFIKSVEQLRNNLEKTVIYRRSVLPVLHKIYVDRAFLANQEKILIARKIHNSGRDDVVAAAVLTSPYAKGWAQVLAEPEFITRQHYIIKFVNHFTRKAYTHTETGPLGQKETEHWFYCIKSNTKLVPAFLYTLATVYVETPDKYDTQMDIIIAKIGKLSDDGDMWVDMYSGYPIKRISSSTDEGFDEEGHRIITQGEIEAAMGEGTVPTSGTATTATTTAALTKILPTDSLPLKYIKTIVNYLLTTLGITLPASQIQFIIETTIPLFETHLPNEIDYNRTLKMLMAKPGMTKRLPSFEDVYNNLILYLTLGTLFVAIQTAVPPVTTRKTFPTCIRSFAGYPFDGEGDLSGIHYVACALSKIKNIAAPWTVLPKKEKAIADKIREHIDKYIITVPAVKLQFDLKTQWLETHQPGDNATADAIAEYNVSARWVSFLPPLVPFKLAPVPEPVTREFRAALLADIKSATAASIPKIIVLQSKTMQFAFAIQESIQAVIAEHDTLLQKSTNEPYLENACCINTTYNTSTVGYFTHKKPDIVQFNTIVREYSAILYDIREYTRAPQLWCPLNDKIVYAPIPAQYSEKTIYNAYITFCNLRNYQPVPADFAPFCSAEKPAGIHVNDTLNEMIVKLKSDGANYTYDGLQQFLQAVARTRIIELAPEIVITPGQQLLHNMARLENAIHGAADTGKDKLRVVELVKDTLATATQDDLDTGKLNNYLLELVPALKTRIGGFMKQYLPGKTTKDTARFLANFANWKTATEDLDMTLITSNLTNKMDAMFEFLKNAGVVFPQMIINKAIHAEDAISPHWELAESHAKSLQEMIRRQYAPLAAVLKYGEGARRILETIPGVSRALVNLADKTRAIFITHRTGNYLAEYYILRTFVDYIDLADRTDMLLGDRRLMRVEDIMADYDGMGGMLEPIEIDTNDMVYQGNLKTLREHVAAILSAYMEIFMSQKELVDLSVADIQEIVYRTQEAERKGVTDRLEAMTVEERAAENMMKQYKLGEIWGMGLQKALVEYDPEMYEKQRGFVDEMINAEMQARSLIAGAGGGAPGGDILGGFDDDWADGGGGAKQRRNRDEELDDMAWRENTMPGDDYDAFGDDNDYGNLDGEDYAGGEGDW